MMTVKEIEVGMDKNIVSVVVDGSRPPEDDVCVLIYLYTNTYFNRTRLCICLKNVTLYENSRFGLAADGRTPSRSSWEDRTPSRSTWDDDTRTPARDSWRYILNSIYCPSSA